MKEYVIYGIFAIGIFWVLGYVLCRLWKYVKDYKVDENDSCGL